MDIFLMVLILLSCIAISNIINRLIPIIPVPLIQIILGIIVAIAPIGIKMPLNPGLFMVLFIAPLLFNDGKMVEKEGLWKLRTPILLLALGLVFTTVVVIGLIINWMIPEIPLSASFALAAILSPTDAVAVSALSKRIHLPQGIMPLLEGEALMNDASGLVAFKFAVAATVSGTFSLHKAAASFLLISIGGLLCGAVIAFLIIKFRVFIRRLGIEDDTFHVLIQILTPFIIYLLAEELGLSGILAVVAGGIVHSIEYKYLESTVSKLKTVSESTWSVILFVINGLVFIVLGLQLPDVGAVIFNDDSISNLKVFGYIIVISITLILLRFIWICIFWNDKWGVSKRNQKFKEKLLSRILTALSGVRGAVTLAGAFSIPYTISESKLFPQRDLIIFISAGVILFTLIMASVLLPILGGKKNYEDKKADMEIFKKVMEVAVHTINENINTENRIAALSLISGYRKIMKNDFRNKQDLKLSIEDRKLERQILNVGVEAEYCEIKRLYNTGEFSSEALEKVKSMLDDMESYLVKDFKFRFRFSFIVALIKKFVTIWSSKSKAADRACGDEIKKVKIYTSKAAVMAIRANINDINKKASLAVIDHYNEIIRRINRTSSFKNNDEFNLYKKKLQFSAVQAQRNEIQRMFEEREISREMASKLREFINYQEALVIEECMI